MPVSIHAIYRYPIKGLGPEALREIALSRGCGVKDDRRHVLALPGQAQDASAQWLPKRDCMALHNYPELANVDIQRQPDDKILALYRHGRLLGVGDPDSESGRHKLEDALGSVFTNGLAPGVRLTGTATSRFTDAPQALLSIVSLASLDDLTDSLERELDIRRFRANLVLSGGLPWQELDWVGDTLSLGELKLRVLEPIVRCAATRANPANGLADLDVLRPLTRQLGEPVFGVYAEVLTAGVIRVGDTLSAPESGGRFPNRCLFTR